MMTAKVTSGTKDIFHHYVTGKIDTKEKFEKERYALAVKVWTFMKERDSAECRHCHNSEGMDPEKQNEAARASHAKMKAEKTTCIDCHFGIAHSEPDGPGPRELKIAK
jgi:cytochrome c-type protein NapC